MSIASRIFKRVASAANEEEKLNIVGRIGSSFIREGEDGLPELSKVGKATLAGAIGVGGGMGAMDASTQASLGYTDGKIHSPTPDYSQYLHMKTPSASYSGAPAGADGSLVFALDKTKNGGFL